MRLLGSGHRCRRDRVPRKPRSHDARRKPGDCPIDEIVEELAEKAEAGYDVDEILRRRGGRPPMGTAAASVESVRLDPELSEALREQAQREGRTNSDVIREALRDYLRRAS
jgi:hypothetical protein